MAADGPSERERSAPLILAVVGKPTPASLWTDLETAHLIDAYEEKWNTSKRGPLKAQQWEDVASEVGARCTLDRPNKSGTQCRHKIEKLRKRYRSERLRPVRSLWPFFDRINRMECGQLPVSGRPHLHPPASSSSSDFKPYLLNKLSINGNLGETVMWGSARVSRNTRPQRRRAHEEEQEENNEDIEDTAIEGGGGEGGGFTELAMELRRFGEGYVRIERKRIELKREIEREWMEMESRRLEMVMQAQRCLVETVAGAFWKKSKNSKDL